MIITRRTDNDLYKLSMQQAVWRQYPKAVGRYKFSVRTANPAFPLADIAPQVADEVAAMEGLRFSSDELDYMAKMPWFKEDYIEWLESTILTPEQSVNVSAVSDGSLSIDIDGNWCDNIPYEVPVLAITEELYCAKAYGLSKEQATSLAVDRLGKKLRMLAPHPRLSFTDFGTRRRFSRDVHEAVVKYLFRNSNNLVGTSNLWLARTCGLKPIGTVAHEWFMAHLALVDRLDQAQKRALHVWQQEYGEQLGTALTDTFTTKAFWRDFDSVLARGFSGVRHDSGDPFTFGWAAIEHYKKLGIDPRTKNIVFSDSLDFPLMIELFETFTGLIGVGFGIGTNLTNDLGYEPLSIVMKLMELNGVPLVKISDAAGKVMGDRAMVSKVCKAFGVNS